MRHIFSMGGSLLFCFASKDSASCDNICVFRMVFRPGSWNSPDSLVLDSNPSFLLSNINSHKVSSPLVDTEDVKPRSQLSQSAYSKLIPASTLHLEPCSDVRASSA
ncbi:hypothetical protein BU16DRAFT_393346 [Lophium mytilinum]|uniref:Uncharacterized protein n=1 Tax=Lophium mytilinum TaxID=390894 RepID=A0A6A6QV26_9PEZI|nr:hypothetical protein BU16DRAFT_393346 [Lophium mytilinum]